MQVRENRADHTASAYWNDRIADICSLLAAKRKPFRSIVDAMPVVYFDTPAGQAMICCWKRVMLWLGIGMMGLQLAPDTGETRERARRISRSCFPTRCYGYGSRLSRTTRGHGTEIQRHRGWRRKSSRNILHQVYESAPAECSLLHPYIGMRENRVTWSSDWCNCSYYCTTVT
jgi:hypothetical protein